MIRSPGMLVVGLTGGIGSGKSTVSAMLAGKGAVVVDTDVVAREVAAPGGAARDALVARFGAGLIDDRSALADVVFADPDALADLNGIVHPAVREEVLGRLATIERSTPEAVVILDVPLLVETGVDRYPVVAVIVVDAPGDEALARVVRARGMDEADARRRGAAQATRAERLAAADIVVDNSGSLDDLRRRVDEVWAGLVGQPPATAGITDTV